MDNAFASENLLELAENATDTGPLWTANTEDMNCTFVVWPHGHEIVPHVNNEVDVLMTVVSGEGLLKVDGREIPLMPGVTTTIPKGCERSVNVLSNKLAYLNVHKRRQLKLTDMSARPR